MDFAAVVIFLGFYYVRPQEWIDILSSFHPITLTMAVGLAGVLMKEKGVQLRDFFRTPHDWVMYALIGWIVYASPDSWGTWGEVKSYLVFYIVIVQSLTTVARLKLFLTWWTWLILGLAAVALAGNYGFDPLGSQDITVANQNRLCVALSIFANPNALGHNVVPGLIMAYFLFMWGRPIFMQQLGFFILLLPAYCVYLTFSKGAFLSGFIAGLTSFIFGRPVVVQILVVWVAITVGWAALFTLPRMEALQRNPARDEGIAQRIKLWQYGWNLYQKEEHGVGYMNWWAAMYRHMGWIKAPHSSYVQVGGELGKKGFFLYLAVLYVCLRTLITAKTATKEEERVRRMLFVLVVSYSFSSWMIDFGYRPTYFMFAAACAAFHRILHFREQTVEAAQPEAVPVPQLRPITPAGATLPLPGLAAVMAAVPTAAVPAPTAALAASKTDSAEASAPPRGIRWNRIGLIDIAVVFVMVKVAERFWLYAIGNM